MGLPTLTAVGHVGFKDFKQVGSGKNMCSFMLTCSEKNKKGEYDKLNIKVTVWEGAAEFVNKYINDGDVVEVVGKIETNEFTKDDGTKVKTTQFKFPQVNFVPKPFSNNQGMRSPVINETIPRPEPLQADELPF